MIIRTYQRRNRSSRSLSDNGNLCGDGVGSSGSQESLWGSSQEPPFSFPSSQESCWSQSDYGNSNRSFKSTRRQSQDDDFDDNPVATFSRPPISRTFSERPPLSLARRNDDDKFSGGKLRKAQSEFPRPYSNGNKFSSSRGLDDFGSSSKAKREWVDAVDTASAWGVTTPTSSLMEAQESGEMMEHVDEANFALDGLRPGQPVRIQRASLTSLLSLCGSMQRRRMLRTHGMAKPLLDAIVALPTDDPPLALAAAAVLYFLAIDSQEEDLLDSEPCVLFLMKLLGTNPSQPVVKKGLGAIGSRLAAFSKSTLTKSGASLGGVDRGAAVVTKVHDLFKTLREHGAGGGNPNEEISSKWLALLTLEKACISTVILEDSSAEAVRKVGGQFKERLRELGGLDTVCQLAANCLVNLTEALNVEAAAEIVDLDLDSLENNDKSGGIGVLLRCLRVMENVTFLSEQNQKHLLQLRLSGGKVRGTECFIGLTINAINTLSELAKRQNDRKETKLGGLAHTETGTLDVPLKLESSSSVPKGKRQRSLTEFCRGIDHSCANGKDESQKAAPSSSGNHTSSLITFKRRKSSNSFSSLQNVDSERSQSTSVLSMESKDTQSDDQVGGRMQTQLLKQKIPVPMSDISQKSASGSDDHEWSELSDVGWKQKGQKSRSKKRISSLESLQDPFAFDDMERAIKCEDKLRNSNVEDSQDPFAFDDVELDFKTDKMAKRKSKRELSGKARSGAQSMKAGSCSRLQPAEERGAELGNSELLEGSEMLLAKEEGNRHATLLRDCLLSGVKVLMNLTNDNPVGCSQVAACGGFNSLSSLLIANYPWPRSPALLNDSMDSQSNDCQGVVASPTAQSGGDSDQDLDLLVSVLGVLCNLVEKDVSNRAHLASLKVAVPDNISLTKEGRLWQETGMIGLLCSLFLTKQGAGEAAEAIESKRALEMEDEVKQGQAEAEDMIVEAYTALLLGFLSKESERARMGIVHLLPGEDLKILVPVLERFVAFHLSLNMISPETHSVVMDVIVSCKRPR